MNDYKESREKIYRNIKDLYYLHDIYDFYTKNFVSCDKFNESITGVERTVLIMLRNSIVIEFLIKLRCLMSSGKNDTSLVNLYKDIFNTKNVVCRQGFNINIQKKCLPNSYDKWVEIKKYINKCIAHNDPEGYFGKLNVSWENLQLIMNELYETFKKITSQQEDGEYFFNENEVDHKITLLFKKMLRVELK